MPSLSQVNDKQQATTSPRSSDPAGFDSSPTLVWFCNKFGPSKDVTQAHVGTSPADQLTGEAAFRVPIGAFPDSTPATSARALMDILALKTSLVTVIPTTEPGLLQAENVICELQLRALFMKALAWYLERECINLTGAYVVLVGQDISESARVDHPAVPVDVVRSLATEQDIDSADVCMDDDEFDAFMFHAAGFIPAGYGRNLRVQQGIMALISTMATFFLGFYLAQMCGNL